MSRLQSVNKIRGMVIRASKEVGGGRREMEMRQRNPLEIQSINHACVCNIAMHLWQYSEERRMGNGWIHPPNEHI